MAHAMRYDGKNACAICAWATGMELKPYELAGGFWMKQFDEGDFFVKEDDGGFVRLNPEQMKTEHPLLFSALTR